MLNTTCSAPECDRGGKITRGMCGLHYDRWRKAIEGTDAELSLRKMKTRSVIARFTEKYSADPDTGCWMWQARRNRDGYGMMRVGQRMTGAHIVGYEEIVGPVPDGCELDHLCRNRACVNPEHLEAVTHQENVLRGNAPAARQAKQTHCKNGHELAGVNLSVTQGKRGCRICKAAYMSEYLKRRKAAALEMA